MAKQIEKKDVNRVIEIKTKGNQTPLEASTEYLLKPSFLAASVIDSNKQQLSKDHIDLQYTHAMLEKSLVDIKKGGLADVEEVLYTQACALNMMFSTLVMRANKQEYMSNLQTYMSLAFKAQNQSRTTLQALVDMKQPNQTAFIKQANIAHGHQLVNNFPFNMTWTAQRRQRQRELIQTWKPWNRSTGARTPEGKARSSQNATKSGSSLEIRELIKQMNAMLREQKDLLS